MISEEEIGKYREQGWVVVEGVLGRKETERIADEAMAISLGELNEASSNYAADRSADGQLVPRKIDKPFFKSEHFRRVVLDRRLREILEVLLGHPPLLLTDQIFMKPPKFGSAKPYHQDNAYFCCFPVDELITAWIALDDVDEENGCLRYIDGSHKTGLLPHMPIPGEEHNKAPLDEDIDFSKETPALVKRGGVVFHHGYTLHTSHRNESKRWRRAYATHWATGNVRSETDIFEDARFKSVVYADALKS